MRFKVYIDYTGTGYQEIIPDNINPFKLTRVQPQKDIMQFFSRIDWGEMKLSNSPLRFKQTNSVLFRLFDILDGLDFSTKVLVKHYTDAKTIIGYFSRNDCTFDYDRKIVTVTPATIDKYTPILENWETEVDFSKFVYDKVSTSAVIHTSSLKTIQDWPTTENYSTGNLFYPINGIKETDYSGNGGLNLYFDDGKPKSTLFADSYYGFQANHKVWDNQDVPLNFIPVAPFWLSDRVTVLGQVPSDISTDENYGPNLDMHYGDYELSMLRIYEGTRYGGLSGNRWRHLYCATEFTREETTKKDVPDVSNKYGFQSPVGKGWHMRKGITTAGVDYHIWTRKPFNGAFADVWELQPVVDGSGGVDKPVTDFNYYKYLESRLKYKDTDDHYAFNTTLTLRDFINYIMNNSGEGLNNYQLKSTFFFNDFENEISLLNGTTGFNYVTGEKNYLNNLRLFFTRDLLALDSKDVRDTPKYSLKSLLDEFNTVFVNSLMWFVDKNGYLRLEHTKFIDLVKNESIDISTNPLLIETTKWSFDKSQMFERFEYKQTNAGYIDFTDNYVTFDKIVSNNRNKDLSIKYETQLVTTDLRYCISNPSNLADGFVLMALDSTNLVINKIGAISKELEINGALALSNLLLDFGRYEGIDVVGVMNGQNVSFKTVMRNKIGIEITLKGTVEYLFYITQMGYGMIDEGTIDFEREFTKVKLRYRFNSAVNTDQFVLSFQNKWDFEGAVNIWADQANYIKI